MIPSALFRQRTGTGVPELRVSRVAGATRRFLRARFVRPLSFLAVGGTCFFLQLSFLVALLHLDVGRNVANAASFLAAAELKFIFSRRFVWRDRSITGQAWRRFAIFNATTIAVFLADQATFVATAPILGAVPGAVLGVAVGTVVSYVVCDRFVFRATIGHLTMHQTAIVSGTPSPEARPREIPLIGADANPFQNPAEPAFETRDGSSRLWLIVPAHNEEARLGGMLAQYQPALSPGDRLVIVVNGSTDSTEDLSHREAAKDPRLIVIVDERKIGKGGALIEGYRFVSTRAAPGDVVAYTDADAAVAGNDMVGFCAGVPLGELRIGSRWHDPTTQLRRQPLGRQIASRVFNGCVRALLRLKVKDTQCSAKVLRAESLPDVLGPLDSKGFAFDVDLILSARAAGLAITEVPVAWTDQEGSTVSMRRAAPAMLSEVVRLRRKYASLGKTAVGGPPAIWQDQLVSGPILERAPGSPAEDEGLLVGSGLRAEPTAAPTTGDRPRVLSGAQKVVLLGLGLVTAVSVVVAPIPTLITLIAMLTVFFCAANLVKLDLVRRGATDRRRYRQDHAAGAGSEGRLPVYTILLPLYHEDSILRQLVEGITALDYPQDKLDVKLLLEEDDDTTRQAAANLQLPACFDIVIIPDHGPTGKPRACNAGLAQARGEYLVIYDAEDRPEPDQLRKAVTAFSEAAEDVICMQAKLNYFNRTHNVLTRWFTAEYSLWFDQLLPGLQAMDVAIPLGGTSNHFRAGRLRELGGWDAYNVTEDADLGVRIYVKGWKTAILDSTTYEEATSRYHNWVRQRSRWVKGYMQTYLHHMAHPLQTYRQMGPRAFTMLHLFFGAATLCVLINPVYWFLTMLWFTTHYQPIESVFPRPLLYLGLVGMFVGNAAFTLTAISGAYLRKNYDDVKWALLSPLYWVLMSVAAWKALIQLCYKPFYWEKTVHGYCMYGPEMSLATGDADVGV